MEFLKDLGARERGLGWSRRLEERVKSAALWWSKT
jgi:hypothetical protein